MEAAAQGTPGGTLNVGKPYELSGYDPHPEGNQTSWEIHAVVYESLVWLDDNLAPVPGLAESWEQPDDRTYVFKIRQGVKFHNGREMTADDVFYSLNRVLTLPAAWWDTKMGPLRIPDEAEQTAVAMGTPESGPSVGLTIEATGPYEFRATTSEPFAPFLASLSGTDAAIVPGQELEAGTFDITTQMIGTGPFQLTEHLQDTRWTFDRFADYWREGLPMLDQVVWHVNVDEQARVTALRNGEIHITTFENPTMLDLVAGDANITSVVQPTTNYWILFQNGHQPELADERVRQAIVLGIDRQQLVDIALFGRAQPTGPIAAAYPTMARPMSEIPFHTRDVERAKQLLADAGYGGGLKLPLLITPVLAVSVPMAELIKAQLAEIGIEIEIVQRDLATFVQEYIGEIPPKAHLTISWWAGYADPYMILLEMGSNASAPFFNISDPAIDDLLSKAATTLGPAERLTVLRQLEDAIATKAAWVPLVTRDNFIAYRNDLIENVTFANGEGFGLPLWHKLEHITLKQA
jgi:peptide/nickel transport system substrate-binding protein